MRRLMLRLFSWNTLINAEGIIEALTNKIVQIMAMIVWYPVTKYMFIWYLTDTAQGYQNNLLLIQIAKVSASQSPIFIFNVNIVTRS